MDEPTLLPIASEPPVSAASAIALLSFRDPRDGRRATVRTFAHDGQVSLVLDTSDAERTDGVTTRADHLSLVEAARRLGGLVERLAASGYQMRPEYRTCPGHPLLMITQSGTRPD